MVDLIMYCFFFFSQFLEIHAVEEQQNNGERTSSTESGRFFKGDSRRVCDLTVALHLKTSFGVHALAQLYCTHASDCVCGYTYSIRVTAH